MAIATSSEARTWISGHRFRDDSGLSRGNRVHPADFGLFGNSRRKWIFWTDSWELRGLVWNLGILMDLGEKSCWIVLHLFFAERKCTSWKI